MSLVLTLILMCSPFAQAEDAQTPPSVRILEVGEDGRVSTMAITVAHVEITAPNGYTGTFEANLSRTYDPDWKAFETIEYSRFSADLHLAAGGKTSVRAVFPERHYQAEIENVPGMRIMRIFGVRAPQYIRPMLKIIQPE